MNDEISENAGAPDEEEQTSATEMVSIVASMREQLEMKFGFTVSGFALALVKEDGEPVSVVDCRNFSALRGILECIGNITMTVADVMEKSDEATT